ncbi:unnamed protein product, partial [Prorocentrum cordatum]
PPPDTLGYRRFKGICLLERLLGPGTVRLICLRLPCLTDFLEVYPVQTPGPPPSFRTLPPNVLVAAMTPNLILPVSSRCMRLACVAAAALPLVLLLLLGEEVGPPWLTTAVQKLLPSQALSSQQAARRILPTALSRQEARRSNPSQTEVMTRLMPASGRNNTLTSSRQHASPDERLRIRLLRRRGLQKELDRGEPNGLLVVGGISPDELEAAEEEEDQREGQRKRDSFILQLALAVVYYFAVVRKYRSLEAPPANLKSSQILDRYVCCAVWDVSPQNLLLSCYCMQSRAAHTFDKTGACAYWPSWLWMYICPCCAICYLQNSVRQAMNASRVNPLSNCCSSTFCACCVVAQQAQALDCATGQWTTWCGDVAGSGECRPGHGERERLLKAAAVPKHQSMQDLDELPGQQA